MSVITKDARIPKLAFSMKTVLDAVRAFLYMTAFVYLWGWLALQVRVLDERPAFSLPAWAGIAGGFMMIAGGSVALLCVATFVIKGHGTPAPFDAPRKFVGIGPYKLVRNPMYLGGGTMLIGFALLLQSLSMVLFSLVWFLLAHLFVVYVEEPGLERRFGQSYLEYRSSVNRWLPKSKS
jgi:protein-S-isoprenylcysteine O-methyltransferase Ste14